MTEAAIEAMRVERTRHNLIGWNDCRCHDTSWVLPLPMVGDQDLRVRAWEQHVEDRVLRALLEGQYVLLRDQLPKAGHLIVIERDPETDDDLAWYGPYSDVDAAIADAHVWHGEYGNAFSVGKLFDSPAVFRLLPAETQEPAT